MLHNSLDLYRPQVSHWCPRDMVEDQEGGGVSLCVTTVQNWSLEGFDCTGESMPDSKSFCLQLHIPQLKWTFAERGELALHLESDKIFWTWI